MSENGILLPVLGIVTGLVGVATAGLIAVGAVMYAMSPPKEPQEVVQTAALSPGPPAVSEEEAKRKIEDAVSRKMYDGYEITQNGATMTINVWDEKITATAELLREGDPSAEKKWDSIARTTEETVGYVWDVLDNSGGAEGLSYNARSGGSQGEVLLSWAGKDITYNIAGTHVEQPEPTPEETEEPTQNTPEPELEPAPSTAPEQKPAAPAQTQKPAQSNSASASQPKAPAINPQVVTPQPNSGSTGSTKPSSSGNSANSSSSGNTSNAGAYAENFSAGKVLITTASNNNGKPVYHTKYCVSAQKISPNDMYWYNSVEDAKKDGRQLCGNCKK